MTKPRGTPWFKTHPHSFVITEVLVVKHSATTVTAWEPHQPAPVTRKIHSDHSDYWPTLETAKLRIQQRAGAKLRQAQTSLKIAEEELARQAAGHFTVHPYEPPPEYAGDLVV